MAMPVIELISTKRVHVDGLTIETVVWLVPKPVPPARNRYKYSLFCGWPGDRLVAFDNESGKGDHKHVLGIESAYTFTTLEQLLRDFAAEIEKAIGRSP
jgi:hypothetical protein